MIGLIVNADDLGSGTLRDRGIFVAFAQGIVTSASLLANGPSFATAARTAADRALPAGVHLNLSEGMALTGRLDGVTDDSGRFPGKVALRRLLQAGAFDRNAVRRELLAQIAKVRSAGIDPDHLDTHQHCLLFPALTGIVVEVAVTTGIRALRLPVPAEADGGLPGEADCAAYQVDSSSAGKTNSSPTLTDELALYHTLAPAARATLQHSGLWTPDGLWGMPLLNRLNTETLADALARIPAGTWELMTHPGCADPEDPFGGREREIELAALTAPEIRQIIEDRNMTLTSFGACACAC